LKLKIITHSGGEYEAIVDSYDAALVNADLNDNQINTVAFADVIISRIDVKAVIPISEAV